MRLLKLLFGDLTGSRVLSAVFVAWDGVCCVLAHRMDIWICKVDGICVSSLGASMGALVTLSRPGQ